MSHFDFRVLAKSGIVGLWKTLYKQRTMKVGSLIGTDVYGNQYFENRVEYAHGQHRWVVYAGDKSFYEVDASFVPPEWHSWLHHVTEEPPTATTVGSTHKTLPDAIVAGSSAPYVRNLGGVVSAPTPNLTQVRPRAFGLGNGLGPAGSAPNAEGAYTQPGFPTDPRNDSVRARPQGSGTTSRRDRLGFSLKDTPLTLEARTAARVGLPFEQYARFVDDESPTRIILRLTGGGMSSEEASELSRDPSLPPEEASFLAEAAAGIPKDPEARALAVSLALSDVVGEGAFEAALAKALTVEERSLVKIDVEALLLEANTFQSFIDSYKDVRDKDARAGVKGAVEKRDKLLHKVELAKSAKDKYKAVAAEFDARAQRSLAELPFYNQQKQPELQ